MLTRAPAASTRSVNAVAVNCAPWSVLKISGRFRPERLLERLQAELAIDRDRQLPRQHVPAEPVENRHQVHEAVPQPHVRDVGAPHLVDTGDRHVAQQVRIDLVARMGLAQARFRPDRLQPHPAHQALHVLAIHRVPDALLPTPPASAATRRTGSPCTARRAGASTAGPPRSPPPGGSRTRTAAAPAGHTAARRSASGASGRRRRVGQRSTRSCFFFNQSSSILSWPIS